MPSRPATPYFILYIRDHGVDVSSQTDREIVPKSALIDNVEAGYVVYDAEGRSWPPRYSRLEHGFSWLTRLAAKTVYDPLVEVGISWTLVGSYELGALQDAFIDAVKHDNDILTQWRDEDKIVARIERSLTYDDLISVWEWIQACPDDEEPTDPPSPKVSQPA
ncbi:MAG: hypothetical protein HYY93_14665 [Planctomycetes bacterium]|nr:hypothetical protein [Planctomycetota bacterium]